MKYTVLRCLLCQMRSLFLKADLGLPADGLVAKVQKQSKCARLITKKLA